MKELFHTEDGWVLVSKQASPLRQAVLTYRKGNSYNGLEMPIEVDFFLEFADGHLGWESGGAPSHWRQLPVPPETSNA